MRNLTVLIERKVRAADPNGTNTSFELVRSRIKHNHRLGRPIDLDTVIEWSGGNISPEAFELYGSALMELPKGDLDRSLLTIKSRSVDEQVRRLARALLARFEPEAMSG